MMRFLVYMITIKVSLLARPGRTANWGIFYVIMLSLKYLSLSAFMLRKEPEHSETHGKPRLRKMD